MKMFVLALSLLSVQAQASSLSIQCQFGPSGKEDFAVSGRLDGDSFALESVNDRVQANGEPEAYGPDDLTDEPAVVISARATKITLSFGDDPNWLHTYTVKLPRRLKAGATAKAALAYEYSDEYGENDTNSATGTCSLK